MNTLSILTNCLNTSPLDLAAANDGARPTAWLKKNRHLVETRRYAIQLFTVPEHPIHDHHPGASSPDFDKLAYFLATRFEDAPYEQVEFVSALPAARKLYGGHCHGLPKNTAASHDAMLAQFFFSRVDERTKRHLWVGESKLSRWKRKPDALILDPKGRSKGIIIEIGGHYPAAKLKARHEAWWHQRYQIW